MFVHDLGGHPQKTWSTQAYEPTASGDRRISMRRRVTTRLRRLSQFTIKPKASDAQFKVKEQVQLNRDIEVKGEVASGVPQHLDERRVFWPRDLLPKDAQDVRIMTFGYYSHLTTSSQDNLYTLSMNLLNKLSHERVVAPNRPMVFVAHSLGGILVKFALKNSQESTGADAKLRSIRESTEGVIFFGTPHLGSDMASWGELLTRIAGAFSVTNSSLITALNLKSDNGQLEELSRSFVKMLGPRSEGKFQAFNFRETDPLHIGPTTALIVPLNSSKIDSEWAGFLTMPGCNHRDICKFGGSNDPKYMDFISELRQRFLNDIGARNTAINTEAKAELNEEKREWLNALYTCPYVDRKNINPQRAAGTCEWFISHDYFKSWQESREANLLWVSADPGCGKSVLARALADEVLPSTDESTTCYFFFKDGFEDQKSSETALCCILRQIMQDDSNNFTDKILRKLQEDGKIGEKGVKMPPASFQDLWDLFICVAMNHRKGQMICIFDALDECEEIGRNKLINAIINFYSKRTVDTPVIKFLLTSRPYLDIKTEFLELESQVPTIHLSGETEEQVDKITCEIDLVIRSRIAEMFRLGRLGSRERDVLDEELAQIPNRTYLWVHLIFDEIKRGRLLTQNRIRSEVHSIPRTIDEAYESILMKSPDIPLAKRLLHIVVGAKRPLTLQEMAVALAIGPAHRSIEDMEPDLAPDEQFCDEVRALCGLFVVVVNSRIHLLHQTAREFLVPQLQPEPSTSQSPIRTGPQWKFSLHPAESNRILANICMWRLSLSDFGSQSFETYTLREDQLWYIAKRRFLGYAVEFWTDHFRHGDWENIDLAAEQALNLFNPQSDSCLTWIRMYETLSFLPRPPELLPMSIAARFGLPMVVQQLLKARIDPNMRDNEGRTPLHQACLGGHSTVVQQLLRGGTDISAQDNDGRTSLHQASIRGNIAIVQELLQAGANVNVRDADGQTPLHSASEYGQSTIVHQLLEAGADANMRDKDGKTPLHWATDHSDGAVAQKLLKAGVDANIQDGNGWTPLFLATENRYSTVVRILLEAGADPNPRSRGAEVPLHRAIYKQHSEIVEQLLQAGADANVQNDEGKTPLHSASSYGYDTLVQQLLEAGADANIRDKDGRTPTHRATFSHLTKVKEPLEASAGVDAKDPGASATSQRLLSKFKFKKTSAVPHLAPDEGKGN